MEGGDGNDVLQPTELGRVLDGGGTPTDIDRLSYELLPVKVTATRTSATSFTVSGDAAAKMNFEQFEGTALGDTLIGYDQQDVLVGGGGDDLFMGRGGGDILDGGTGLNTVSYANAPPPAVVRLADEVGSAGGVEDRLFGIRSIIGGPGNDVVTGSSADETVSLGDGDDQVDLGDGNDSATGGIGNDVLRGGDGNDTLDGGDGTDTATYDERGPSEPVTVTLATPGGDGAAGESDTLVAIENLTGGESNDSLTGDDGPNVLLGGPGLNTLDGQGGADTIRGGPARDVIVGGKGADQLYGEADDDSIAAFDGEIDLVSCGASLDDDAQVDANDQVEGCEFASRGDVPVPVDGDGDGFVSGFDCNDTNKGISPSAVDIPGDKIDQNCDGFDEAVPFVDYGLKLDFSKTTPRGRLVTKFVVTKLPADHRVLVTCKGATRAVTRRCPFRRLSRRPAANREVSLTAAFKRRRLSPNTTLELQVTAPKFNGRVLRLLIRKAAPTRQTRLCIIAPRKTPQRCPEGDE